MLFKKYTIIALFVMISSFSLHAMDLDEKTYEDVTKNNASFFDELKNNASLFFIGKPSHDFVFKTCEKIRHLNSDFHARHHDQQSFNAFHEMLADTREHLDRLPNELRNRIISECFNSEAYDLVPLLKNSSLTEEFNPNYISDLRTPQRRYTDEEDLKNFSSYFNKEDFFDETRRIDITEEILKQEEQVESTKFNGKSLQCKDRAVRKTPNKEAMRRRYVNEMHPLKALNQTEQLETAKQNSWLAIINPATQKTMLVLAGTAACAAIAGGCYYLYKKACKTISKAVITITK